MKIKSNAKQLITNGLTRANNFIQGISIPFTGWIKDAFGGIISKAKGFVTDMFNKYAPKPVQYMVTPDGQKVPIIQNIAKEGASEVIDEVANDLFKLGANKINHILQEKHFWSRLIKNPQDWVSVRNIMEKAIKEGTTEPYNSVWKKVLKYNEETVEVTYAYVDGVMRISDAWVVK